MEKQGAPADAPPCVRKYYGLSVPRDGTSSLVDFTERVFRCHGDVLKALKKYPGSRFKCFDTEEEAATFAAVDAHVETKATCDAIPDNPERAAFGSVKTQDLCQLRVSIERGDLEQARMLIRSNPRYLISAGDTPTLLQENFRYNALHVAGKAGQAAIARLVLDTIADVAYLGSLYPQDGEDMRQVRISRITDMYLNTPDKGCYETPLHFASKHGHAEMVMLLLLYPTVNKNPVNKFGQTPYDVACTRAATGHAAEKKTIQDYLRDGVFYVPLLRAEDNSLPPVLGEPWSPTADSPGVPLIPSGSGYPGSPSDIFSCADRPDLNVAAYAGPMSSPQGKAYKKNFLHKLKHLKDQPAYRDPEKGHEAVLRELAAEIRTAWHEWWDFLGCHVDLRTDDGLRKLESHLAHQRMAARQCCGDGAAAAPLLATTQPCELSNSSGMCSLIEGLEKLTLGSSSSLSPPPAAAGGLPADPAHSGWPTIVAAATATSASRAPLPKSAAPATGSSSGGTGCITASNAVRAAAPQTTASRSTAPPVSRSALEYILPAVSPVVSWLRRLVGYSPLGRNRVQPGPEALHSKGSSAPGRSSHSTPPDSEQPQTRVGEQQGHSAEQQKQDRFLTPIFVCGHQPTKRDCDVLLAIGDLNVDSSMYPHVAMWRQQVMRHPADVRDSWHSPRGLPDLQGLSVPSSTPRRLTSTPLRLRSADGSSSVPRKLLDEFHSVE